MKIAMYGHKRIPSREGGIEVVVEELCARMVQRGCEVTCYNRRGHHVAGSEFDQDAGDVYRGIRLKSVPTVNRRGLAAFSSSFFAAIACAFGRYDVVHVHAEGPAIFCWIPKLAGKKVVCTIHGLDYARAKWGRIASALLLQGEKCAVRFADDIIVLNPAHRKYFARRYGRRTVCIPNGVERPKRLETDRIRKKWGLEKDGYILFVGRIVPEKGLRYLIRAYRRVRTGKKLVIAGGTSDSGDFPQKLKKMAEGDDRILFTGFVEGQELGELYSNAYLYVLPSDLEGMPLTLLEAMSYGRCCLVSDIPECTEVTEDHAMIFRKSDENDLAGKLQYACDHAEETARYSREAADYICRKYSWEDVTEKTLRVYRSKKGFQI